MKNYLFTLLSLSVLVSCGGDDEQQINVNFKLEYNQEPLVMFQEYDYAEAGGIPIEFSRISFYVSEVKLNIDGQEELFKDADYIDLTESHSTLEKAEEGYTYNVGSTTGDPSSISFNFGLTSAQNATVPTDYPSSSALSRTAEYWTGWSSYVMYKIEGNMDLDGDGVLERPIALHMGTDSVTRFTSGNYDDNLTISLDIQKIFNCNGEIYDIEATPMIHNLNQVDKAEQLADNIECAIEYLN
jgi:hypothetical protein